MKKLITSALILFAMSSNSFAGRYNGITMADLKDPKLKFVSNVFEGLSVVEVLAAGKGSGVLVLLDGKVVVITNSHNLQGRKTALVTQPRNFVNGYYFPNYRNKYVGFKGMAKVLYDFPLSDVAVLDLPENDIDEEEKALLKEYALLNGAITSDKGWTPSSTETGRESVVAVLEGKPTELKGLDRLRGSQIKDSYISGDGSLIWAAPIYTKPGVSGGAYYRGYVLEGLVTKISLSAEPIVFATPFSKVAKLINSPDPIEKQVHWEDGQMVYEGNGKTVVLNPLGNGWLGNGGELVHLGQEEREDSNPNYWRIQARTFYKLETISTWDPFVYRPGNFMVNDNKVSFVRVKSKGLKSGDLFRIPTLASFIASERAKEEQTLLKNTTQNLELLKQARLKRKTNLGRGRVYTFDKERSYFKLSSMNMEGDKFAKDGVSLSFEVRHADRDRYIYKNDFFSIGAKFSDSTIFDIRLSSQIIGYGKLMTMTAPSDLSKVTLNIVELDNVIGNDKTVERDVVLYPEEFNSPQSLVFKSEDGLHKAIFMYANEDLTKLGRVYVLSGDVLVELWE